MGKGIDMTKSKLIYEQAMKISKMEKQIRDYNSRLVRIHNICCCIGGPLNDNKLDYTREQMGDFFAIVEETDI